MSLNVDVSSIFSRYKVIKEQNENILQAMPSATATTTGEEHSTSTISVEMFDKFEDRIAGAKKLLRSTFPFYFFVLERLKTVPTTKVNTMAVDDFHNIYMNPEFVLTKMTLQETSGVLAHEASHIWRRDFARLGPRRMDIWNVASDYIINKILLRDGHQLPSLGLIPKRKGDKWFVEETDIKTGKTLKIDISDITTEDLYDILLQQYKKNEQFIKDLIDKLIEKQKEMDEHIDTEKGMGQPTPSEVKDGAGNSVPVPGPYKPNPNNGESKGEKEAKAKNITDGAVKDAQEQQKSRGNTSGTPQELEREIKAPTVNWQNVLRQFLKKGSKSYYNIKRPNKRAMSAGYYAPRMEQVYNKLDAVITLDTSGSISEGMIQTFVSEVISIIKAAPHVRALLVFWENYAYSPRKDGKPFIIEGSKLSLSEAEKQLSSLKVSRGGTNLSSITPYYNKTKSTMPNFKPAVLITFTDGAIEDNPVLPSDIPFNNRVFLINNLGSKGQGVMAGDDSIVKKIGKYVYGVKVEG